MSCRNSIGGHRTSFLDSADRAELKNILQRALPERDVEGLISDIDAMALGREEQLDIMRIIADELTWGPDWEPDEHGLRVEKLISYLNWFP